MKIKNLNLGDALAQVRCVVNPKSPIHSHVLLEVGEENYLSGTNAHIFARAKVECDVVTPGAILIDCTKLSQLNNLGKLIDIEQVKQVINVKCGRSKLKFPILDPSLFPRHEEPLGEPWFDLNWLPLIDRVAYASAELMSGRPNLEAVMLGPSPNGIKVVGTNSYRLAELLVECDIGDFNQILIPAEGLKTIKPILAFAETQKAWIDGGKFRLQFEDVDIWLQLIDDTFPDYEPIFPKNPNTIFQLKASELIAALKVLSITESDKNHIGFAVSGNTLRVWSFQGAYQAQEEIEITGEVEPFSVGFNSRYLTNALRQHKDEMVEFHFAETHASCLIIGVESKDKFRQVVACMTPLEELKGE